MTNRKEMADEQLQWYVDEIYQEWIAAAAVYDSYARACGLTPVEHDVLWAIGELGDAATQKAIARYTGFPKQTVSSVIAKEKAAGRVASAANAADARSATVTLTPAGHVFYDPIDARRRAAEVEAMRGASADDLDAALRVFRAFTAGLRENLGCAEGGDAR